MNILVINCAYKTRLGLINNNDEMQEVDINEKTNDNLLGHIEKLLKANKLELDNLDVIGVCIGPGSFTGLRASISLVKGICTSKNIKVITFTSFEELEYNKEDYLVLEGFSSFVYILHKGKAECKDIGEVKNDIKTIKGKILLQTESLKDKLGNYQVASKKTQIMLKEKIKMANFSNFETIEPLYLRASQAEIEREKKIKNDKN